METRRVSEMAQRKKALAVKPEDQDLTARIHRVEGGHRFLQTVFWSPPQSKNKSKQGLRGVAQWRGMYLAAS